MRFTNFTNLALNGWLGFGPATKEHAGLAIVKLPVSAADAANTTATEKTTGFTLQAGWVVLDAWLYVNVADATETVSVGTNSHDSGTANGFIADASLGSTGYVFPGPTTTAGGNETYLSANTCGSLLSTYVAGTNTSGDHGIFIRKPYPVTADIEVTFTTSNGTDTGAFDIYLLVLTAGMSSDSITTYNTGTISTAS